MNTFDRDREIDEAIDAGYRALRALEEAENYLNSARNFGIWDMFGGGVISSMMKHSKMDQAQRCMERAQYELRNFSRELQDVQIYGAVQVNFDGLTKFFDVFCDNFIVDFMVQSKINETRRNVAQTRQRVEDTIRQLRRMRERR
ncbi:MAG: hypothetical protein LUF92_15860 [Clostridiales bacterium]|nr:hypothetical protein [Clostridiales bacterium]